MTTQNHPGVFGQKAEPTRQTRRWRALGLDALTLVLSLPATYVRIWLDEGAAPSSDQFRRDLVWVLPLCFLLMIARRFAHARRRGNADQYDYAYMNPLGKFDAIDFLSAVPHVDWERHRGETAFFDNILDRERFIDAPGLAICTTYASAPVRVLQELAPFRSAALHWDVSINTQGGYNIHAVFDIPPPSANQWTSDHGARMWMSINPGGISGSSNVRVVFGSGGFGQGQPAAAIMAGLPLDWFPVGVASWAFAVEAELRGAVSWWILVGRALGVGDAEFSNLKSVNLAKEVAVGTAQSLANRETGKVVLWAIVGGSLLLFGLPLLLALLSFF